MQHGGGSGVQAGNVNATGMRGFSLIELIVSIVVLGIVAVSFGVFILPAITAHQDMQRRAALVADAEGAIRRMSRDIRISLPNSLRITNTGSGFAIEMIPTLDGARYCVSGLANCSGAAQELDFSGDSDFDVLGCFRNATFTGASFPSTAFRLVIGDANGQIYTSGASPAVATNIGASITLSTVNGGGSGSGSCGTSSGLVPPTSFRHHIAISGGHQFSTQSPRQRVFVLQSPTQPVSYICDTSASARTLTRYSGYAIQAAQPTTAAAIGAATIGQVAGNVSACSVASLAPQVQSTSLVTLSIALSSSGETVQLMSQVQLDNSQ